MIIFCCVMHLPVLLINPAIANTRNKPVAINLPFNRFCFAFLKASVIPPIESRYMTNPDIMGAATCMHGYVALEGFGITLTRNHTVDSIPITINNRRGGNLCCFIQSVTLFIPALNLSFSDFFIFSGFL